MSRRPFLAANLAALMVMLWASSALGVADDVTKDGDVAALQSGQQVEFSLITALGWVRFTVSGDWAQTSINTKGPLKAALFTISGDPDAGNLVVVRIVLYQIDSQDASTVYLTARQQAQSGEKSRVGSWDIFKKQLKQGDATHIIRTAFRDIADVHVSVRLTSPASASQDMEQTFANILKSFAGEVGSYQRRTNEQIRRPD